MTLGQVLYHVGRMPHSDGHNVQLAFVLGTLGKQQGLIWSCGTLYLSQSTLALCFHDPKVPACFRPPSWRQMLSDTWSAKRNLFPFFSIRDEPSLISRNIHLLVRLAEWPHDWGEIHEELLRRLELKPREPALYLDKRLEQTHSCHICTRTRPSCTQLPFGSLAIGQQLLEIIFETSWVHLKDTFLSWQVKIVAETSFTCAQSMI